MSDYAIRIMNKELETLRVYTHSEKDLMHKNKVSFIACPIYMKQLHETVCPFLDKFSIAHPFTTKYNPLTRLLELQPNEVEKYRGDKVNIKYSLETNEYRNQISKLI